MTYFRQANQTPQQHTYSLPSSNFPPWQHGHDRVWQKPHPNISYFFQTSCADETASLSSETLHYRQHVPVASTDLGQYHVSEDFGEGAVLDTTFTATAQTSYVTLNNTVTSTNLDIDYVRISRNIGIQNSSGTDGLQVAFDQDYLQNALSIKFSQGPEWVTVSPSNGEVASGASEILTITADATGQPEGLYEGYMRLVTGGGNAGVPVTMLVSGESFQAGDINNDQSINVQDVIFLLNFILGTDTFDTPQFNAADINEDDVLNIQDVILLVNIIIG